MNDPTITLTLIKQPDGKYTIRTDTENGWSECGGLVCTMWHSMGGHRIVIVLEPPTIENTKPSLLRVQ